MNSPLLPPLPALAEAMESGRDAVVAAFERRLREQGVEDARISLGAEGVPDASLPAPNGRRAVIRHGTEEHGTLESTTMAPEAMAAWAESIGAALHVAAALAAHRDLAMTDCLTGAGNRRAFEQYLQRAMQAAAARSRPLTLMLFDIDDFKTYNDRFGHAAGDEVLRETVSLLRSVIRRGDAVFRLGGDEFVVVFGDPDSPRATGSPPLASVDQIAVRFAEGIRSLRLPALGEGGLGTISVSAGLATFPVDGSDAASLLAAADRRAFESKRRGKGSITFGPGN